MTLRCKKGDLAMIVRGINSGKCVTVEDGPIKGKPGDRIDFKWNDTHYACNIQKATGWFWICSSRGKLVDVTSKEARVGVIPDHWLLPLRPKREPQEEPRITEVPDAT